MRHEGQIRPGFLNIEDAKRTARKRRSFILRNRIEQISDHVDRPIDRDRVNVTSVAARSVELPFQKVEQVLPCCGIEVGDGLDVQKQNCFQSVQFRFRKFKLLLKCQWHRFLHRVVGTVGGRERPAREKGKTAPRRVNDPKGGA